MAIIQKDGLGLYIESGGWIARPSSHFPTRFDKGDEAAQYHFGGTVFHGVGKDSTCKRGKYLEKWVGCGHPEDTDAKKKESYEWYMERFAEKLNYEKSNILDHSMSFFEEFNHINPSDRMMKPLISDDWIIQSVKYYDGYKARDGWRVLHKWKKRKHFSSIEEALSYYQIGYFKNGEFHKTLKKETMICPIHECDLHWEQAHGMRLYFEIEPDEPSKPHNPNCVRATKSFDSYRAKCPRCNEIYEVRK